MLEDVRRLLSRQEREMLFRYISERDHTAHCAELGCEPGYLRVKVHRIREALRARALPERERNARRGPRRDAPAIVK